MKQVTARNDYRGEDNGSEILIRAGETLEVSDEKAEQLERDFPENVIVDASDSEREAIARDVADRAAPEVVPETGINVDTLKAELFASDDAPAFVDALDGDEAKALLSSLIRANAGEPEEEEEAVQTEAPAPTEEPAGGTSSAPSPPSPAGNPGEDPAVESENPDPKAARAAAKRRAAEKKNAGRRGKGVGKRQTTSRTRRTTAE